MEDQQPDPGDLTTDPDRDGDVDTGTQTVADTGPTGRRRWWPFGRGRKTDPFTGETAVETTESEETAAPRTPVGKSRRTRVAAEPDAPPAEPPVATGEPAAATGPVDPVEPDEEAAEEAAGVSDDDADEERDEERDEDTDEDADEAAAGDADGAPREPEPEPILVPHRPAGRRLIAAAAAAGVLFVGATAFAASQLQPYLADRASVDIKVDIARTATEAVTTLWTYTPDDMETLPDRSSRYLTGEFASEYRRYIDAIVATNKQAQVTNTTEVMGAAVETLTPTEATALVYTNSVSTSPVSKNIPSLRYLSYRLTLERQDAHWMITRMNAVTKLDLTPQI
ncbi:mammalian cell entry protein [Mycobacterium manitobense]|uniref:Mammalian cell entry protein n=1 Tax=[Mycobacterium] manitobense TaxID=190147 RepID=A0A9X2YQS5_9MYCO|nr:mammalian cell entry protein [[Mycobacterium] manitobense]MCV7172423.1 mammalian cell entry protein [[Mycobacterium] manitobense]